MFAKTVSKKLTKSSTFKALKKINDKFKISINFFLILFLLVLICSVCYSQNQDKTPDKETIQYNTVIKIHLKKNTDRAYTSFGQVNPLGFQPPIIPPPPNITDTLNTFETIIKVAITKPTYLSLGFMIFYIEPGDVFDMDFETLLATKYNYKDTIHINKGNVFFAKRNNEVLNGKEHFEDSVRNRILQIKTAGQISELLSPSAIAQTINQHTDLVYKEFPLLKHTSPAIDYVRNFSAGKLYYWYISFMGPIYNKTKDKNIKTAIQAGISNLMGYANRLACFFEEFYGLRKYYYLYLFFKENESGARDIPAKFETCNDTVKQFILLNMYKDGLVEDTATTIEASTVINKLSFPLYKEAAIKIFQTFANGGRPEKKGYINNVIRNTELTNTDNETIFFKDIFDKSIQPYILFDFCGSWCKPCMEEIASYSKSKHLDNNKKVKPIWLFFENDKSKWLNVIRTYGLKKENCFVITGKDAAAISKEFSLLFSWAGEFPHHFLFSKQGAIMDNNAKSFTLFQEKDIPAGIRKIENPGSIPSPPPGVPKQK